MNLDIGPLAQVKPTLAAAAAIRKAVLRPRDQYPKKSAQAAPICLDGADPYLYALYHQIVTEAEVRPFLERWRDEEMKNSGLGSGAPKAAAVWLDPYTLTAWPKNVSGDDVPVEIHDLQHETMQQYTTNRVVLGDCASIAACDDLVSVIASEKLVTDPKILTTNPRAHGRPMRALAQEGSKKALMAAQAIFGKVQQQSSEKSGLPYYMLAPLKSDHANLPICTQQQATIIGGNALLYAAWGLPAHRDSIFHGMRLLERVQFPDGSWANDAGWDEKGNVVLSEPGDVLDLWIVPHIIAAKTALGALWPGKAQKVLDKARALWLTTNYCKPSDINFKWHNTLSITVACAQEWGWRA